MSKWMEFITNPEEKNLVIISAGHGSDTPGKRWVYPTYTFFEYLYNRNVVDRFIVDCMQIKTNVINLVPELIDVPINKKGPDNRIKRLEDINRRFVGWKKFVIDFHGNAFNDQTVEGFEVFTSPIQDLSDPIASVFFQKSMEMLNMRMRSDSSDGDPDKEALFAIFNNPIPTVLLEVGFYSNPKEAAKMMSVEFQTLVSNMMLKSSRIIFDKNLL